MKADPKVQRRLLDLQAIDTNLAQLAHRRRTLAERAELESLARELSSMEDERVRAQVAVDDLDRDIARLEKDVEQVRARKDKDETRLAAGTGPARELEALQHELVSLKRRQGDLEDAELELMEQRETAQGVLDGVEQRLADDPGQAGRDRAAPRRGAGRDRQGGGVQAGRPSAARRRPPGRPGHPLRQDPRGHRAGRGAAHRGPLRRLPAGPVRRRPGPDPQGRPGRGGPLRGLPADHGPHQRVGPVGRGAARGRRSRPTAGPGATPAPPATARWSVTRRPARCSPSVPSRSAPPPTTSPSTRA